MTSYVPGHTQALYACICRIGAINSGSVARLVCAHLEVTEMADDLAPDTESPATAPTMRAAKEAA